MGGANHTGQKPWQQSQEYHTRSDYEPREGLQHESQNGRKSSEAMDDKLRQEYHELLLKRDELQDIVKKQDKQIASYQKIISETSPIELSHRMDELQDQVRQILITLNRYMSENSKMIREINEQTQHKPSVRSSSRRIARAPVTMTEESNYFKEDPRSMVDRLPGSEMEGTESAQNSEERVPTASSTIHRKKAMPNLKSQEVERHASQWRGRHEQLVHSQEQPTDGLLAEISATRAEFLALQSRLKSAEAHIINIGGNLGALLSPDTVKQEFDSLVIATRTWVTTCVVPSISSKEQCLQASKRARTIWSRDAGLRISRLRNQDFCAASKFPGADESIFLVMIFDLLIDNILWPKVMYLDHNLQREVDVIRQLEPWMKLNSESTKRLYNARRWMSEALTAILARQETQALRDDFSHVMAHFIIRTIGLPEILDDEAALDVATTSIRQEIVLPAIELGEKMTCAIDRYTLGISHYWSEPCVFQTQFFHDLGKLDCKNLGDGPPRFRLEKMQKHLSDDEIKSQLKAICPATPALILTEVDDSTWGPPTILVREQVWVSWHSGRTLTHRPEEQGFFWHLYNREATRHGE